MKSFKGNTDYEGKILRNQAIRDGYYEPGFNDSSRAQGSGSTSTPKRSLKKMIAFSKGALLGTIKRLQD